MVDRGGVLRVGDRVVYDGSEYAVVGLSGVMVRLLDDAGQVSVISLAYLTSAPGFALVEGDLPRRLEPLGLLDGLSDEVLAEARMWERHLVELETGLPPGAGPDAVPRPEYDLGTRSMTEREKAKAAELAAAGVSATWRTVQRKRQRYREQGLLGLVNGRALKRARPGGRADERVLAAVDAVVSAQTNGSTGTKTRAIRLIQQRLDEQHGPGVVPMPSQATLYRLLDTASAGRHTFGSATTRRSAAGRPKKAFTLTVAARPGEQVQIDATVLDVMALMDDGVVGRPELVAAVDVATRTICAALLRPVGAKAVDAAALLARMMVPEPMRPGWDQALRMSASRLPYQRLVSVDRRLELAAAKPVIVPETVVIDHGKVFISETFTRAARSLGISVQPARPRTPTDKAVIERTFSSINTLFCQHVAAYTGRDVTRRGLNVAEQAVWSVADLQELLDEWIVAGWQSRAHEGLRHPLTPDRALSPNEAYAAMVAAAGYVPIALGADDYVELLPVEYRTIGDGGIQIDYRFYNDKVLGPLRHRSSGDPRHEGRWEVHYDPYDLSRVWVRDTRPDRGGWITVPWTQLQVVMAPFADFTWRYARRAAAARGMDDTNEASVAVVLAGLLARAGQGPDIERRAMARARANAELAARRHPALPAPPPLTAPAAEAPETDEEPRELVPVEGIVPFKMLSQIEQEDW